MYTNRNAHAQIAALADREMRGSLSHFVVLLPLVGLAFGAFASPAFGQDAVDGFTAGTGHSDVHGSAPIATALRANGVLDIDGELGESAWSLAEPITDFIQTEPNEGEPATERTEVYVLYDDDALYIGARMWESTGSVRQRLGRRDSFLSDSDWFYVMLDSYHDHVTAYQFSVNPAGVKRDERPRSGSMGDASWDAVWDAATSVDEQGWTAELRIPFSQLRFKEAAVQTWGVQFSRRAISKEEVTVFSFTPKSERGGVARYGHLTGLVDVKPGRTLEVLPYAVARAEYLGAQAGNPFRDGSDYFGGTGVDLKYRVTSSMTLDATVNPDFGQVEVDPAVVNLSAFETSFDEKRPFFVEGSDIFRFSELRLFYSRRIGRGPQGSLPDGTMYSDRPDNTTILGAAKLTGQTANGWNVGIMEALTAEEHASTIDEGGEYGSAIVEPRANYFAARAEKNMRHGQSTVGGIVTAVNRSFGESGLEDMLRSSAYTGGIDFVHEFHNRSWELTGYFAYSRVNGSEAAILRAQQSSARYYHRPDADYLELDSTRTSLEGYAARLILRKNAGLHWRGEANVSAASPGLEINDLGFQTQVDRIGSDLNVSYVENRPGPTFRNYRFNLRNSGDWNYGRDLIGGRTSLSFNYQLANYWGGNLSYTREYESYDDRLTRGGPVAQDPAGNNVEFRVNSDGRKRLSVRTDLRYSWGESGGWNRRVSADVTLRPAENWTVTLGPELSQSRMSAQYLTTLDDSAAVATFGQRYIFAPIDQTRLSMEARLNVNVSPDLSFDVFAQPFIATGDYGDAVALRAPRTYSFDAYEYDTSDTDFNTTSLRGNAVMRWEWRPGSTLFVVWQQRRARSFSRGDFDFGRDSRNLFDQRPANVFLVKMNYWLNF